MGKDHIWDSTQWDRETGPKDHKIQHSSDRETGPKDHIWAKTIYGIHHSGTGKPDPKTIRFNRETRPKDHIWDSTQLGQGNQTQRPYMGKDHIWDSTQWDRETGPKDHKIQQSSDRETRPKDHKYGQRPYMGFTTVGQGNRAQRP